MHLETTKLIFTKFLSLDIKFGFTQHKCNNLEIFGISQSRIRSIFANYLKLFNSFLMKFKLCKKVKTSKILSTTYMFATKCKIMNV